MKKILSALILITTIAGGLILPVALVYADDDDNGATAISGPLEGCQIDNLSRVTSAGLDCRANCTFSYGDCPTCCVLNSLYNVTDVIFFILLGLAAIYVILGAMNLLMSAGDPSKVSSGRNYIMYAMIGLMLTFLARAVPAVVRGIVGS
jgi:hypothetical protein